jgi:hypothetical protein
MEKELLWKILKDRGARKKKVFEGVKRTEIPPHSGTSSRKSVRVCENVAGQVVSFSFSLQSFFCECDELFWGRLCFVLYERITSMFGRTSCVCVCVCVLCAGVCVGVTEMLPGECKAINAAPTPCPTGEGCVCVCGGFLP